MSPNIPSQRVIMFCFVAILCMGLASCGGSAAVEPEGLGEDSGPVTGTSQLDEGLPETLGIVLDPDGLPVPFAIVGNSEMATKEGVFSGTLNSYDSGWTTVKAMGYATAFTRPFGEYRGVDLYEARLTSFKNMGFLNPDETAQLVIGGESDFIIELEIDASAISETPALVGLTNLDLLDVGPVHEPSPSTADLKPQYAFAVEIFNEVLESIDLHSGATYSIYFDDAGQLSPDAKLCTFNPETGAWVEIHDVCSRETPTMLNCTLDQLSPLMAWFDAEGSAVSNPTKESITSPSILMATIRTLMDHVADFLGKAAPAENNLDENYQKAHDILTKWIKEQERKFGGIDPDDPTLKKLMEDLFKAARDFAKKNRNEAGKFHLLLAAQSAMALGVEGAESLIEDANDISDELGRKALNESNCGEFLKILLAAQQIQLLGGDQNLSDQLNEKVREMAKDCDVWVGWIRVIMPASSDHPADMSLQGGGWWTEYHGVQMWTNVDDYVMHGLDRIQLNFPEVTYIYQFECKDEIKMYGNPPSSMQSATFQGSFDGYTFQVGDLVAETDGIGIGQSWDFEDEVDGFCQTVYENQFSIRNFVSVIAHGLTFAGPIITIQEMLDEGTSGVTSMGDSIFGTEDIVNPDPEAGMYPFTRGVVVWRFIHTQKKLPLE